MLCWGKDVVGASLSVSEILVGLCRSSLPDLVGWFVLSPTVGTLLSLSSRLWENEKHCVPEKFSRHPWAQLELGFHIINSRLQPWGKSIAY